MGLRVSSSPKHNKLYGNYGELEVNVDVMPQGQPAPVES